MGMTVAVCSSEHDVERIITTALLYVATVVLGLKKRRTFHRLQLHHTNRLTYINQHNHTRFPSPFVLFCLSNHSTNISDLTNNGLQENSSDYLIV